MRRPPWLRSPGYLPVIFAVAMLLPAGALVWLGWLLIEQDRALERQQRLDRLERRADQIVDALQLAIVRIEESLPNYLATPPSGFAESGASVVRLAPDGTLAARTGSPVLYGAGRAGGPGTPA